MKITISFLVSVAFFSLSAVSAQTVENEIARKQLDLGIFALKQGAQGGSNVTLSPYSIHSALMLLRLGAKGDVALQLDEKLLPQPLSPDEERVYADLNKQISVTNEKVQSTLANSVWLGTGYPFTKSYLDLSTQIFSSEPRAVDFEKPEAARATINDWVSSKTNRLIPTLLAPGTVTSQTTCVLVNALYFKSAWLNPFDKVFTKEGEFWTSPTISVKTPLMWRSDTMGYFEDDAWQGVHLPYQAYDFLFVALVPKERWSVSEVANSLSSELLGRAFEESQFTKVNLSLPRFKARFGTELVGVLEQYGLTKLRGGDYSGISSRGVGGVDAVIHEAVVSVDEGGTEAAAATALMMAKGAFMPNPPQPKEVRIDRPFVFALVHRSSKAPLFMGIVGDPR
jgi:serpin B